MAGAACGLRKVYAMKLSFLLVGALALVLVATSGCIVCPFPDSELGSSQFITYKVADFIPANEWTPIGEWTFHQSFEITGAMGVLNAQVLKGRQRMKTRLRYRLYDDRDVMISEQIYRLNFKSNGNVKKLAEKRLEKDILPGYRGTLETLSNRDIHADTQIGVSFNVVYDTRF